MELTLEFLLIRENRECMPRYSKIFGIGFHECLRALDNDTLLQYKNNNIILDDRLSDIAELLISRGF